MKTRTILAVLAALAIAACGKSAEQKAAEQLAEAAKQAADASKQAGQGAQSLAQGMQQLAQSLGATGRDGKPVPPVDFEKLEQLLPSPGGWEKGKSKGQQMSMGISMSTAEVSYTKGERDMHLTITDAAFSQLFMAPFAMYLASGYSERSSDGYKKGVTLGGQPGFEEWRNDGNHGEVTVIVGKRFVVAGKGSVDKIDDIRALVEAVDFNKLAALK